MNMKCLITASFYALVSVSAAHAADVVMSQRLESSETLVPEVVISPNFSWSSFYLGVQAGGISNKVNVDAAESKVDASNSKDSLLKFSNFLGGLYVGSNVDLGDGVVLGLETDMVLFGQKDITTITLGKNDTVGASSGQDRSAAQSSGDYSAKVSGSSSDEDNGAEKSTSSYALKQIWSGATRLRVGFAVDRVMPYVAGGVAYTQIKNTVLGEVDNKSKSDETKVMIGYSLGAGVDFEVVDNIVVRAEYRYSSFGKKKFAQDKINFDYKTNDFRVGVAYKF